MGSFDIHEKNVDWLQLKIFFQELLKPQNMLTIGMLRQLTLTFIMLPILFSQKTPE